MHYSEKGTRQSLNVRVMAVACRRVLIKPRRNAGVEKLGVFYSTTQAMEYQ